MIKRPGFLLLVFGLILSTLPVGAEAKSKAYMPLARLSYMEGNVSHQHSADVDWSAASINLPLEPGDRIYTGNDGRAEIEFEDGSIYRLARGTDVEILSLSEDRIQMRVLVGLSTLMADGDTDFEIDTPAAAFTVLKKGVYRFGVDENGDSEAIVRKGEIEAANNNFARKIRSGEMVRVLMADAGKPVVASYDKRDAWDEWNDRRNADMKAYRGGKYLPANVYIGVYDLHRHGRWVHVESYGLAWVPYGVSVFWSPYSVGRWVYRPFYGWTWVSYEPWGWLPYHYGRWYRSGVYGWCWLPGPSFAFNFWSPALVTFYTGPGWISWCPLGPGDYYNLSRYHFNRGIYSYQLIQLRALHTRAAGDPFHRNDRDAFHTVDIDQFRNGSFRDTGREGRRRDIDQPWKQGEAVNDRLPIQPTVASFKPAPERRPQPPTRTADAMPVVVRSDPEENLRGQDRFRRISNPAIPSLPNRTARRTLETAETPQREILGSDPSGADASRNNDLSNRGWLNRGSNLSEPSERRSPTYRWAGTVEKDEKEPRPDRVSGQKGSDDGNIREGRRLGGIISERPSPTVPKGGQSSGTIYPNAADPYQPNKEVGPASPEPGRRYVNRGLGYERPSNTGESRTLRTPDPRDSVSDIIPKTEGAPSRREQGIEPAPSSAISRPSKVFSEREGGPRSFSEPSQKQNGVRPEPSLRGRSESNRSTDRSGEGGFRGRDRK